MRNPDRLDNFYDLLHRIHKEAFPDWRFGQFISNFFGWCLGEKKCSDIWFPEDSDWSKWLTEYALTFGENNDRK